MAGERDLGHVERPYMDGRRSFEQRPGRLPVRDDAIDVVVLEGEVAIDELLLYVLHAGPLREEPAPQLDRRHPDEVVTVGRRDVLGVADVLLGEVDGGHVPLREAAEAVGVEAGPDGAEPVQYLLRGHRPEPLGVPVRAYALPQERGALVGGEGGVAGVDALRVGEDPLDGLRHIDVGVEELAGERLALG